METGTIVGDEAYSVQYLADAPRFAGDQEILRNGYWAYARL